VGSELGCAVRPFFGAPDLPFEIVREIGGNFYVNVIDAVRGVFGFK
ncbi:MAG: actin-binding WH2 domain-containing protein, partial [Armatimonadetes bacterium]|nr:actin-binding WH2 domain-containing protein [Armatimonadota bacterium]